MKFKDYRKLAAAMDVRIRQLTADGIHGAAVIDHMVSHLSDLQRIWVGTSDAELLRLTEEFPGFYEYASLMEEAAEAERQKPSRSYDGLPELPNALKEMISALLSTAAVLERRYRAAVDAQRRPDLERQLDELAQQHTRWLADCESYRSALKAADVPEKSRDLMMVAVSRLSESIADLKARALQKFAERAKVHSLLPNLTANGRFMHDFLAAPAPCFALGLVEERKRHYGVLALQPTEIIAPEIYEAGFNFGHAVLGTADYEVIQFSFHFYGFQTYHVLVNPNNPQVQAVITRMVEAGEYFFFAINSNHSATAFRADMGQSNLTGLRDHMGRLQRSSSTEAEYQTALDQFRRLHTPPGQLLTWVCRDEADYLDLTQDRFEMRPAR
jgi:hypothetical protein